MLRFCEEENKLISVAKQILLLCKNVTWQIILQNLKAGKNFHATCVSLSQDFTLGEGDLWDPSRIADFAASFCHLSHLLLSAPSTSIPICLLITLSGRLPGGMPDTIRSDPGLLGSREARQAGCPSQKLQGFQKSNTALVSSSCFSLPVNLLPAFN